MLNQLLNVTPENIALNFFLRMLLGHLIGDFILQPLWLALDKRQGWRGLLLHVTVVTFATAVMIWQIIPDWLFWTFALFVVHLFIDQFRTFVFTDNSKGKGFILLILDQIAHVLSIMLISWLATGWQINSLASILDEGFISHNGLIYSFCLLVFAIWVVPILEIELVVAIQSYQGVNSTKVVPISFSDRIMGALERLIGLILIIISWRLLTPLVFLPRLYWLLYKDQSSNRVTIFLKMGTSFATVLIIGILL